MARLSDPGYLETTLKRVESIPDDKVPAWGTMRKDLLIEHLIWAVRASMGQLEQKIPRMDNVITRKLVAPLVMNGWVKTPKNVKFPSRAGQVSLRVPGGMEDLRAALTEYVDSLGRPDFRPDPHPAFGDIGPDGWDKMHYQHLEHHIRQFEA
ncbi:MAG: DUF1569 domain-containing protein [Candidatus Hydrogenedens sp.]|nr:DUF1569 domain-containing protein [Candidatus Hydrogenedens sp.]